MFIQLMNCQGPMARHVEDLRAAFAVMATPHTADPFGAPVPLVGPPVDRPVRVAVVRDPLAGGVDPQVARGVARAADVLADAGYALHEIEPPMIAEAVTTWGSLVAAETALLWPLLEMIMCESGARFVRNAMEHLGVCDQPAQMAAWMTRLVVGRAWAAFQEEYPLILAPISTIKPWPAGWDADHVAEGLHTMRIVLPVNLLGLPAAAVPVGVDEGLPQAVQLIGRRWREDLCLDAAAAIEAACGTLPAP
jgi:amidase